MKKIILALLPFVWLAAALPVFAQPRPGLGAGARTFSRARYRRLARRALVSRLAWASARLVVDRRWRLVLVSRAGLSLSKPLRSAGSCSGSRVSASTTPSTAANLVLLRSALRATIPMFLSAPAVGKASPRLRLPELQHRRHHLLLTALGRGK